MEQNKQTPARRRRNGKPASARKNYASEGDVLTDMPFPADFPATPMKSNTASPAPGSQPPNSKSIKKTARKPRPNNVSTSPGPAKPGRRTPPHSATVKAISAAASAAAFASANFHASPAPASLPMPSFLRMGSESAVVKGPAKEPSPPASDCESPSPSQQVAAVAQVPRDESPLDLLFRADRAEKERARRATSANATAGIDGPFSPPSEEASDPNTTYSFEPIPLRLPTRPAQRGVSNNSGTPGSGVRPEAFTMPLHERIRAARAAEPRMQQQPPPREQVQRSQQPQHLGTPPRLDEQSEAVKRLLGIGGAIPSPQSKAAPLQGRTNASGFIPSLGVGSKSSPQVNGGSASMQGPGPGGADDWRFRGEHALRQALKLPFPVGGLDSNSNPQQTGPFPGHA
ncbi:hypothetical protein VP1G_04284 [Cytospora mali]|uniref:Uncharacterized protein n=1 Tax=Cytospora mali TaxID=578113 RepID=A0A194UZG5_CYTMA|nr:hypothetical protein VP1G_04284 [Valsa mali var. pyri (nom. inval.)]